MSDSSKRLGLEADAVKKYGLHLSRDHEFFDFVWGWLKEDEFDPEADGAAEDYDACMEHYAKVFNMGMRSNVRAANTSPPEEVATIDTSSHTKLVPQLKNIQLDDVNSARQHALTEYLHKTAALDRDVMSFRAKVFGGRHKTLSRGDALRLLEQAEDPQEGVPVVLVLLPEGEYGRRFRVAEDSVWGRLSKLAGTLSRRYPWDEGQAAAFVLCGNAYSDDGSTTSFSPPIARVRIDRHRDKGHPAHPYSRTVITMKVASWVPAEQVKEAYSKAQRELNDGKRLRPPSLRCIEVFRFVMGHSAVETVNRAENLARLRLPPWRELRERWDETHSAGHAWHYGKKGLRNFRRDFGIGQDNVLGAVAGGLLGIPGEPRTLAQQRERRRQLGERLGIPESLKKRYGPNVKVRRLN